MEPAPNSAPITLRRRITLKLYLLRSVRQILDVLGQPQRVLSNYAILVGIADTLFLRCLERMSTVFMWIMDCR